MSDYKDTPIIERLRGNILFNWSHLSHYGDDMREAADALEQAQIQIEHYKSLWNDTADFAIAEEGKLLKRIEQLEAALNVIVRFPFPEAEVKKTAKEGLEYTGDITPKDIAESDFPREPVER